MFVGFIVAQGEWGVQESWDDVLEKSRPICYNTFRYGTVAQLVRAQDS